jgi:hypothetical protein
LDFTEIDLLDGSREEIEAIGMSTTPEYASSPAEKAGFLFTIGPHNTFRLAESLQAERNLLVPEVSLGRGDFPVAKVPSGRRVFLVPEVPSG